MTALTASMAGDAITYGSAVKLASTGNEKFFLRSLDVQWNGRSRNGDIVTTIADETNPGIYWVIEPSTKTAVSGDLIACGSKFFLKHGVSGKYLFVDVGQINSVGRLSEVTAIGDRDSTTPIEWIVECSSGGIWSSAKENWEKGDEVGIKHAKSGTYLKSADAWKYTQSNCPRCPMVGEREVGASPGLSGKESLWRVEGGVIIDTPKSNEASEDRDEL